jgi:hypothetical protein
VLENCIVTPPIKFNCWKHHAGFIKEQINLIKDKKDIDNLPDILLKIGESQMDLYISILSPNQISENIIEQLKGMNVLSSSEYKEWLFNDKKDYQLLKLPDKSVWVLRWGVDRNRYIHIHPGRHSTNTIRVKFLTLKTAICILSLNKIFGGTADNLSLINSLREKFLKAPPLKSFSHSAGLGRLLSVFNSL